MFSQVDVSTRTRWILQRMGYTSTGYQHEMALRNKGLYRAPTGQTLRPLSLENLIEAQLLAFRELYNELPWYHRAYHVASGLWKRISWQGF
jgi:hypothetical protein